MEEEEGRREGWRLLLLVVLEFSDHADLRWLGRDVRRCLVRVNIVWNSN